MTLLRGSIKELTTIFQSGTVRDASDFGNRGKNIIDADQNTGNGENGRNVSLVFEPLSLFHSKALDRYKTGAGAPANISNQFDWGRRKT
jgi:hypothetical protein